MNKIGAAGARTARIEDVSVKYAFARHETFHPRFGWIKKGFDAVVANPRIFFQEDAHITLGVGKNMAQAIRYWCAAFKVTEQEPATNGSNRGYLASQFGHLLLAEDSGWDQFLENPASLWLLHWNLLKSPCLATAWRFVFNDFRQAEFSSDDLMRELSAYRDRNGIKVLDSSLNKDITCLLRMYVEQPHKKQITEETLDCPFVELGLIQQAGDAKHYVFRIGAKSNLPAEIVVASALEYVATLAPGQKTISIANLTYGDGSPGLAFKLTESAICQAIEEVSNKPGGVSLTDSAGLVQMSFQDAPEKLGLKFLKHYYSR